VILLSAITIGALVAVAILQLLQRDVIRMVLGLFLLWNGVNLLLILVGATGAGQEPTAAADAALAADPIAQAFVLTAIVITFGFLSFLATLAVWLVRRERVLDIQRMRRGRC
jgi:multicomponent Na+:H+ antiporter subunit C